MVEILEKCWVNTAAAQNSAVVVKAMAGDEFYNQY